MRGLAGEVGDATASTRRVDEPSDIQEIGDGDLASSRGRLASMSPFAADAIVGSMNDVSPEPWISIEKLSSVASPPPARVRTPGMGRPAPGKDRV
ncbi:MAG: hypothetical protein ACR2H0_08515 [Candidatus Limnocylindrales bacterium]